MKKKNYEHVYDRQKQEKKKPKKLKVKVSSFKTLKEQLDNIYILHGDLSTTCLRQCNCCRVACPQMNYSEAVSVIDHIWQNWSKEDKANILVTAIKYFFSKSLIKPCPMIKDNGCLLYDKRPLGCRLYGLWPKDVYEKRVETVSNALKLPKEQVPLNTQCNFVKRINKQELTIEQINDMYNALDKLDLHLFIQNDLTLKEDIEHKIGARWNYRTIHDWILFLFFGEEWLVNLTSFSLAASKEALDDFVKVLEKDVVPKLLEKKIV